jgi:hypothetical protein
MASKNKRFNAFDDFSGDEASPTPEPQNNPPAFATPLVQTTQNIQQVERIERLKPSQMLPDRFQPRRLLPAALRQAFFNGQRDCYQTAAEWLALAHRDNGARVQVDNLLAMGSSFEEHGQIKPITGTWLMAQNGQFVFQIETGERRFWAACLQTVNNNIKEEPQLRVEIVNMPTRQRQVLENRHAEAPSAVGQACEVSSLILAEMGIQPDAKIVDDYDFFRLARSQRMPAGLWEKIMPIMQLTRPRMVQLLNILQLPSPMLDLADRYRLPERVLREVLALPKEQWERTLRASIQNNLTSDDVAELSGRAVKPEKPTRGASEPVDPARIAASGLRRFANAISMMDEVSQAQALDEIADDLVATHQAEGILALLDELSRLVDVRLSRL